MNPNPLGAKPTPPPEAAPEEKPRTSVLETLQDELAAARAEVERLRSGMEDVFQFADEVWADGHKSGNAEIILIGRDLKSITRALLEVK